MGQVLSGQEVSFSHTFYVEWWWMPGSYTVVLVCLGGGYEEEKKFQEITTDWIILVRWIR